MNAEVQHFLTDVKNGINKLDLQLLKNKIDYDETLKSISQIQKSISNIKNIVKVKQCFEELNK